MITDGRTQGLRAAGFPVGCASPGVRGQLADVGLGIPRPGSRRRLRSRKTAQRLRSGTHNCIQ